MLLLSIMIGMLVTAILFLVVPEVIEWYNSLFYKSLTDTELELAIISMYYVYTQTKVGQKTKDKYWNVYYALRTEAGKRDLYIPYIF